MAVDHISSMKAAMWEEAKGKLRALVALSGSSSGDRSPPYQAVGEMVEQFIKEFEDSGYEE